MLHYWALWLKKLPRLEYILQHYSVQLKYIIFLLKFGVPFGAYLGSNVNNVLNLRILYDTGSSRLFCREQGNAQFKQILEKNGFYATNIS